MSLIDSLIDELNKSADEWNESNMFELARMCRNAAYTILELQNDAELLRAMLSQKRTEKQCYVTENAKLREQVARLFDKTLELGTENAKLRELVKRMFGRVNYECRCCSVFCSDWDEDNECCVFTTLMRELGVEVDE